MNKEERVEFRAWVESNPIIPANKTHFDVWKEKRTGDLEKWF